MPIRVLIVDDSALVRDMLSAIVAADPGLEVAGTARDPYEAREKIKALDPQVITLDVEMPNMNGIAFLERLMRLRPLPVVMVSTLTRKGADVSLLALELGAVDAVAKPAGPAAAGWERAGAELRAKIHAAASARVVPREPARPAERASRAPHHPRALLAIGASTGGVEALREVLGRLPAGLPPTVVAQHMPAGFTQRFAQRLDECCAMRVAEAADGLPIGAGEVVVAPGDRHLTVERRGAGYVCALSDGPPVSGHRPSVDVLFRSAAAAAGRHAVGVILTGMGRDGAAGLGAMRAAGARTIGQDAASSLVYGMPRAAFEAGAVTAQVPLRGVADRILADLAADALRAA